MLLKDFKNILIFAFAIGFIADLPSLMYIGIDGIFGFFAIAPLVVLLLFFIFSIFNIKNKFLIVFLTVFCFFLGMIFGFYQWIELRNQGTDMSGLLFYIGAIPSIVVGLVFGFLMARRINKPL